MGKMVEWERLLDARCFVVNLVHLGADRCRRVGEGVDDGGLQVVSSSSRRVRSLD